MPEDIGGVPEEKVFKEDALNLPAYPDDAALIEFRARGHSKNRFYVDRNSVSLGADRVVRYTAVIKSPSGAANVSYEALRCKTTEYKVYAYGTRKGTSTTQANPCGGELTAPQVISATRCGLTICATAKPSRDETRRS